MRKISRRGKTILAAGAIVTIGVNAGAAWAYWRLNGSQTVSGTAGQVIQLQASGAPLGGALLYPGARLDLKITVTNPNHYGIQVSRIQRSTAPVSIDGPHAAAGCVKSGIRLTATAYVVNWNVPAGRTLSFTVSKAMSMTNESDSACQGGTFQLPVLVTGIARP
jgi:hypothetical protein